MPVSRLLAALSQAAFKNVALDESIAIFTVKARLPVLPTKPNLFIWLPESHRPHCIQLIPHLQWLSCFHRPVYMLTQHDCVLATSSILGASADMFCSISANHNYCCDGYGEQWCCAHSSTVHFITAWKKPSSCQSKLLKYQQLSRAFFNGGLAWVMCTNK